VLHSRGGHRGKDLRPHTQYTFTATSEMQHLPCQTHSEPSVTLKAARRPMPIRCWAIVDYCSVVLSRVYQPD